MCDDLSMHLLRLSLGLSLALVACDPGTTPSDASGGADATSTGVTSNGAAGTTGAFMTGSGGAGGNGTCGSCSPDLHQVLDCEGNVVASCVGAEGCNPTTLTCANACGNATATKQSVGCEYYATDMQVFASRIDHCFAAFVANTWNTPAKLNVTFDGGALSPAAFARIPSGSGPGLTYLPYDEAAGLPPGEVAILFLSGSPNSQVPCPVAPAVNFGASGLIGTGIGKSFQITSDVPVVTYQINPYGGGNTAITGASLLLPTSAWDTNYVAVNAAPQTTESPSMNIIAAEDNTTVKMLPRAAVLGGNGVPASPANTEFTMTLSKGQQAQIIQNAELTGSILQSDKPIGLMGGNPCMNVPSGTSFCDHGEQMIPPVRALGSEYAAVQFKPRVAGDAAYWRIVGAIDGTTLTYSADVGGPATINAGESVMFESGSPFVVKSQDVDHPFLFFTYMSGSEGAESGYGDPEFVVSVPPAQYMNSYVFFTDPTYPETSIVVIRNKLNDTFREVNLDCAGPLAGWQPVGDYEWTRADISVGNFLPAGQCQNGRHEIESEGPFGLWVWGWGTPNTTSFTANVSYGYPGGMNVLPINEVIIPSIPE